MGKSRGSILILLLLFIVVLGALLAGVFVDKKKFKNGAAPGAQVACCDTGNRDNCQVQNGPGQTFSYNGITYGLIKSGAKLREAVAHLKDSGEKTPNGDPIILNSADGLGTTISYHRGCGDSGDDQIVGPGGGDGTCVPIQNDAIIYVCRQNCETSPLLSKNKFCQEIIHCYGNENTVYDIYFNIDYAASNGIPDIIKNCGQYVTENNSQPPEEVRIVVRDPEPGKKDSLQLKTFGFGEVISWLSPWCKPAVYLYPEETTYVSVRINSRYPLSFTDPPYQSGWGVLASPDGLLNYKGEFRDYLYYETEIPDQKIQKPNRGFVVQKEGLESLFAKILPKLGLNLRETRQFSEYWTRVLPASAYYFVGIIPKDALSNLVALAISPKPATQIRVTLYFEPLSEKIEVPEPIIITPKRTGFTVVEWGGIYKRNPETSFSCFE